MAMDKNEFAALRKKIPNIGKTQELHEDQRLAFLYMQLQERKKILFRNRVAAETALALCEVEDSTANDIGRQQANEAVAQMKALKWEVDSLNAQVKAHVDEFGDLTDSEKVAFGIDTEPKSAKIKDTIER